MTYPLRLIAAALLACLAQAAAPQSMLPPELAFEPNRGQATADVQYLARARGYRVSLSPAGAAVAVNNAQVRLRFQGAQPAPLEGLDTLPGVANYLLGNQPQHWLRHIPTYARIRARNVYPGVDVVYHGTQGRLEYDLDLAPGADAASIELAFEGAQTLRIDDHGDVVLETPTGELRQKKPIVYQDAQPVEAHYVKTGSATVSLVLASYDRKRALVIDPELVFATRIGGSGTDQATAIATDAQGNIYLTGQTTSGNFPVTTAVVQSTPGFISLYRWDSGTGFAALPGGISGPVTFIAADPTNPATAYFGTPAGLYKTTDGGAHTTLLSGGLPAGAVTNIAIDPAQTSTLYAVNPGTESFVTQPDGTVAPGSSPGGIYKSTNGGAAWTLSESVGVLPPGTSFTSVYVDPSQPSHVFASASGVGLQSQDGGATWTFSTIAYLTLAFTPQQPGTVYAVGSDAYIYISSDSGNTWTRESAPVGANPGYANIPGLAADPFHSGTLFACTSSGILKSTDSGQTWTSSYAPASATFPNYCIADPFDPNTIYAGPVDINGPGLAKSTDDGATWTQLGTPAQLLTFAVAPGGRLYLGATPNGNVFVTKLDPSGQHILYSTFVGGSVGDTSTAIAVDATGDVYVTGTTGSANFPITPGAFQVPLTANTAFAFVFKLNAAGDTLQYSSLVSQATNPSGIAIDSQGSAIIGGLSICCLPVTSGAYWSTPPYQPGPPIFGPPSLGADGFLLKLNPQGSSLAYATYLNQEVYITQPSGIFPTPPPPFPWTTALAVDSAGDPYITINEHLMKFTASADALVYSTLLNPWNNYYIGTAVTVDSRQQAYVTGLSYGGNAFVTKVNAQGTVVLTNVFESEHGASGQAIAVDSAGHIFLAGNTPSANFPLVSPVQESFNFQTGFLMELDDWAQPLFSTYVGSSEPFQVVGLALGASGQPIFCGTSLGGPNGAPNGAWVAEYDTTNVPAVRLDSLWNLASQLAVAVSPGEIVTVNGAGLGSSPQLLFDGIPALMIPGQSKPTAIVPYALDGHSVTVAMVQSGGRQSNPVQVPVVPAGLGIFTLNGSGTGPALVFNQDGSQNSEAHPAIIGSTITFYATGAGQTNPPGVDGVLHRTVPGTPVLPIQVTIDGTLAQSATFSVGPASGFPADVLKVMATIPSTLDYFVPVNVALHLVENGLTSQEGIAQQFVYNYDTTVWVVNP